MKIINDLQLYNFLQDLRHLYLIHTLPTTYCVRSSLVLTQQQLAHPNVSLYIKEVERAILSKAKQRQQNYKMKPTRRVVVVGDQQQWLELMPFLMDQDWKQYKFFNMTNLDSFKEKYPFLVLDQKQLSKEQFSQPFQLAGVTMSLKEKIILYAHSQFPFELIKDQIFIGKRANARNLYQINDLKIQKLISLDQDSPPSKFQGKFYCLPLTESIEIQFKDFQQLVQGKTLIYCQDLTKSMVVGMSILISRGLNVQTSALKVFNTSGVDKPCKWMFQQLIRYKF